jgi:hypothetical protein
MLVVISASWRQPVTASKIMRSPKSTKAMLQFIMVESSRGRMVLISSDIELTPCAAIELYCRRVSIETLFDALKNTLAAMAYHFWC